MGETFCRKVSPQTPFKDFKFPWNTPRYFLGGVPREEPEVFGESLRETFYKKVLSKSLSTFCHGQGITVKKEISLEEFQETLPFHFSDLEL
ncbi:MAG TPA: hypothetical protein VNK06_02665, partial [Thermodesulfobacteriota bacterium]|nr:hypothetical protein [Thermodesulfobacteriota bacterium]